MSTGIVVRHARACAKGPCTCKPSYRAEIYDRRSGKKIRKTFHNLSEAKGWRHDAASALRKGTLSQPTRTTLREAGAAWVEGARSGAIRTRSGDVYKPSTVRGYHAALNDRIYPQLGSSRLSEILRRDVQRLVDEMLSARLDASTIRNAIMPLRVIYRRAVEDNIVAVSPCDKLRLPAVRGTRDRIATPDEARQLLSVLPERDQALWATAFYAGLRRGELMALRVEDVDLQSGRIRVERAFDPKEGVFIEPKSRKGRRTIPVPALLRRYLAEHKLRLRWSDGLFFGRTPERPFDDSSLSARAATAWKRMNAKRAEDELTPIEPISLHEARHTYASLLIASGVNAKSGTTYMGHASIQIFYDRYGHLMPGNEEEAASLLDTYLERSAGQMWASEGQ